MARKKIVQRMIEEDKAPLKRYQIMVSENEDHETYVRASFYSIENNMLLFYSSKRVPNLVATFKEWIWVIEVCEMDIKKCSE
jgi:hypothetical protein